MRVPEASFYPNEQDLEDKLKAIGTSEADIEFALQQIDEASKNVDILEKQKEEVEIFFEKYKKDSAIVPPDFTPLQREHFERLVGEEEYNNYRTDLEAANAEYARYTKAVVGSEFEIHPKLSERAVQIFENYLKDDQKLQTAYEARKQRYVTDQPPTGKLHSQKVDEIWE